ncbi:Maf family protein [Xiamenia xianingshaonis]|uniref:dTTP/UTP pyrophosphatase n=1 Tax=Xiamenia xianingshaonis TaxID=2682776 RepID=A0A9E6SU16_9ACTN|nr:Maf family protein [Xiamenia xianingshaonis]NHM14874.1 septum formation protein Maf [Xiamenia xianingshaonis]QTU84040.1 septum formation protein Maf [Xiamenia xianingshaonis]
MTDESAPSASSASTAAASAPEASSAVPAPPPLDIVLASGSPRRRDLLEREGVSFTVRTPATPVDESLEPDLAADPDEACKKLAERKAGAVVQEILAEDYAGLAAIIGADTMVVLDNVIFGKPKSLSDATHMLRQLSGRTHEVLTAVSVWMLAAPTADNVSLGFRTFLEKSRVTFRKLSDDDIAAYLRCGESFDKAGAYAAQGEGAKLIERIDGDLSTVIGLPVERLLRDFPDFKGEPACV